VGALPDDARRRGDERDLAPALRLALVQGGPSNPWCWWISADNFAGSFCGTALIAYMSGLNGRGILGHAVRAAELALRPAGKAIGGISGFVVAAYGYPAFFIMTSVIRGAGAGSARLCRAEPGGRVARGGTEAK
jgi:hypothetical protein